jgi:subtilase family serine protease
MRKQSVSVLSIIVASASLAASVLVSGLANPAQSKGLSSKRACAKTSVGASCHVHIITPQASATPSSSALTPAKMKTAYNYSFSALAGAGKTIAIVDAYDLPTAEADLNTFSKQFGLPPCTTANGCFKKVNQTGGTSYPAYNAGWGLEIAMDIQWAHAIAPGAKILLVEAKSNSFTDLLIAEDYAAKNAQYVSNSWGGSEFASESSYDYHFSRPGVSFFVSAGDAGLPAEYPSASPNVVSVGGTTLTLNAAGQTTNETAWSLGGGGCSKYETVSAVQSIFTKNICNGKRATPDLSLDADPASGVAVYDSSNNNGQVGWYQMGGTSLSAPMVAARAATAGVVMTPGYIYGNSMTFRDIISGNNGAACKPGFDLCAGRGSWINP